MTARSHLGQTPWELEVSIISFAKKMVGGRSLDSSPCLAFRIPCIILCVFDRVFVCDSNSYQIQFLLCMISPDAL